MLNMYIQKRSFFSVSILFKLILGNPLRSQPKPIHAAKIRIFRETAKGFTQKSVHLSNIFYYLTAKSRKVVVYCQ